jgi:hypothetical protein
VTASGLVSLSRVRGGEDSAVAASVTSAGCPSYCGPGLLQILTSLDGGGEPAAHEPPGLPTSCSDCRVCGILPTLNDEPNEPTGRLIPHNKRTFVHDIPRVMKLLFHCRALCTFWANVMPATVTGRNAMINLKSLYLAAIVVASAMIGTPATYTAKAQEVSVTAMKQTLEPRIRTWASRVTKYADDYNKAYTTLALVNVQTPRPPDAEAKLKDSMDKMNNAKIGITRETNFLKLDLIQRGLAPKLKKEEGKTVADFVNKMINEQGVPLSKTVNFLPAMTWGDRGLGGEIQIKFNGP